MATYVIGDVQGCHATLMRLVEAIGFDAARDRLLFVGDLVNRGPRNAELLRWLVAQGGAVDAVLGNHDLHLLGRARGVFHAKRLDTLGDLLEAPDRGALLAWVRRRPVMLSVAVGGAEYLVLHAGLPPGMTLAEARELGAAVGQALHGSDHEFDALLHEMRQPPLPWAKARTDPHTRRRAALQGFVLLRACHPDGTPEPHFAGTLADLPPGCAPWFTFEPARLDGVTVLFGHWAALGPYAARGAHCLDSGCVWGRALTALRLDDGRVFTVPTVDPVAYTILE